MKKQFLFTLLFALCAVFAHAQSDHSSIMFKHHTTPNPTEVASIATMQLMAASEGGYMEMNVGGERASRRYDNAKKKQTAGIVLTAIGGTFLIGGSALLAAGVIGWRNDINYGATYNGGYSYSPLTHTVEIAFGTIFVLAGTGMTIPGAIILAKSSKDMKKYKASQSVN